MHDAPSFTDLNSALSGHLAALPEEGKEKDEKDEKDEEKEKKDEEKRSGKANGDTEKKGRVSAELPANEAMGRIRALIPALREADPLSPMPYRLLRTLKWDGVAAAPPNVEGSTAIEPPRPQQRSNLEGLLNSANWLELLKASEGAFLEAKNTFWLDLQRYTVRALEGLGAPRAAEAVQEEVVRLLKRLDTLPSLWFADRTVPVPGRPQEKTVERTPFASDVTRQWLETLQAASEPAAPAVDLPPARAAHAAGTAEPALPPAEARAIQDLLAKQPGAAFDRLQALLEKAPNRRARFQTRLAAARLCVQANQAPWARTLLEDLLRDSETFTFEDWEPETASDLYLLLALCYARPARKGGPQDQEAARVEIEKLRRKLFRLDLRAAAALEEALRK
jgi:type VI secretion system ImpA/VasJ family protein